MSNLNQKIPIKIYSGWVRISFQHLSLFCGIYFFISNLHEYELSWTIGTPLTTQSTTILKLKLIFFFSLFCLGHICTQFSMEFDREWSSNMIIILIFNRVVTGFWDFSVVVFWGFNNFRINSKITEVHTYMRKIVGERIVYGGFNEI